MRALNARASAVPLAERPVHVFIHLVSVTAGISDGARFKLPMEPPWIRGNGG